MHYSTVLMLNKTYKNLLWQFHFKSNSVTWSKKRCHSFKGAFFINGIQIVSTLNLDSFTDIVRKSKSKVPLYYLLSLCSHLFPSQVHLRYHNLNFTWNRVLKIKSNSLSDKNSRTIKDY